MAATSSPTKPLSFAFSYGFVHGPAHSRTMKKTLIKAGYRPAASQRTADIIIAHSAGCWLMDNQANPKLVVYVGMPLAIDEPRKTWGQANRNALAFSKNISRRQRMARNALLSGYYGLRQPRRNLNIIRQARNLQPQLVPSASSVFVMNRYDPWPRHVSLHDYTDQQDWAFISLPGSHSNLWHQPEHYVAIIDHHARLLA